MRGKLRDKRTAARRDSFKRDQIPERRRPGKRDTRVKEWVVEDEENYEDSEFEADEEEEEMSVEIPRKK